jgi:hypothetical protein
MPCVRCQKLIPSVTLGTFCEVCGNPVHFACAAEPAQAEGACTGCGGDPRTAVAAEVRHERGVAVSEVPSPTPSGTPEAAAPPMPYPVAAALVWVLRICAGLVIGAALLSLMPASEEAPSLPGRLLLVSWVGTVAGAAGLFGIAEGLKLLLVMEERSRPRDGSAR